MQELPIFPLNVVVFPGMPMPLHIFEDRYKEMINLCIEEKRPFGIILIEKGRAEGDTHVVPRNIGCTVKISQVERLEDGRLFIMTYGQERFKLHKLDRSKHAYFVGTVEILNTNDQLEDEAPRITTLRDLVIQYLEILQAVGDMQFDSSQIPTDGESLVYIASALLNIENDQKQSLLESNSLNKLLDYLLVKYEKELALLRMIPKVDMGIFSAN